MKDKVDTIPRKNIKRVDPRSGDPIPFYQARVQAGFASPAENFIQARLNLHELCVPHQDTTYFVEVAGESMINDDIYPGTILVVDARVEPVNGQIVVGWVNGDCTVKRYLKIEKMIVLLPSNPDFLPIYLHPEQDQFDTLGVVIRFVNKPKRWNRDQVKTAIDYVRAH